MQYQELETLPPLHNFAVLAFDSHLDSVACSAGRDEFFGRFSSPLDLVIKLALKRDLEDLVVFVHDFSFELVSRPSVFFLLDRQLIGLRGDDFLPCDRQELFTPDVQFAFVTIKLECHPFVCITSGNLNREPTPHAGARSVEKSEVFDRVGPISKESLWSESDSEATVDAATLDFNVFSSQSNPIDFPQDSFGGVFNFDLFVTFEDE